MTSRLDRLFILLESGSSAVTRRAAAKQIGEVQKLYPHELHGLLNRLISYLHNTSWDTRIAAAQSVEAILLNVPQWSPEIFASNIKKETIKIEDDDNSSHSSSSLSIADTIHYAKEKLLTFAEFDLEQILYKGARLIGSEGIEFDINDEASSSSGSNFDATERLSRQRALLNEKIGFTQAAKLGINLTDVITDEDMKNTSSYNINAEKIPVENILHKKETNGKPLSIRELNRAKRKARQNAGAASSGGNSSSSLGRVTPTTNLSRSSSTSSKSNNSSGTSNSSEEPEKKKLKADAHRNEIFYNLNSPVPDATGTWVDATSWPLELFCSCLYVDLFNPKWEIRHGAATALRELINTQAKGAGKSINMTREEMSQNHKLWLEDASLRLLCVLCLDRFGDYVSDQVVAPVRETCAQVLGTLSKEMSSEQVQQIVNILLQLLTQKDWEVRHGGLLGLKYIFVVRKDLLEVYLPYTISHILRGLSDPVDDVGAVAASTLIPVASCLPKLLNAKEISSIVKMLWDLLPIQDELTTACNSFMGLLAAILSLPNAASWVQMEPMSSLIPRLWPFLSHSYTSVRKSTLITLNTLTNISDSPKKEEEGEAPLLDPMQLQSSSEKDSKANNSISLVQCDYQNLEINLGVKDWQWKLLQDALRHIYQRILVEPNTSIQELAQNVWMNLIKNSDIGALLHAACPFVSSWICLAMQPYRLAFDAASLISSHHPSFNSNDTPQKRRLNRLVDDIGGGELVVCQKLFLGGSESTPLEVREKNYVRARVMASKVLGLLSRYLVQPAPGVVYTAEMESPMDCYSKVLLGHLNSRSAVQRLVSGLIISYWSLNDIEMRSNAQKLVDKLNICVIEFIYYDEVATSLTRLIQEAKDFIATLKEYKVPIHDFDNAKVLTLEQINTLVTTLTDNLSQFNLKPKILEMAEERRRSLQASFQQTYAEHWAYNISTQAALAGAIVCLQNLPEKLNPIVKPLMESIKREDCELLQELSAQFLVYFMQQVCDRNPSPNSKIFSNLCTLLKSDTDFTPKYSSNDDNHGILTLSLQKYTNARRNGVSGNASTITRGPGRPSLAETQASTENEISSAVEAEAKQSRIQRIGATYAITKLCLSFGSTLIEKIPIVEQFLVKKIEAFNVNDVKSESFSDCGLDVNDVITSLQFVEIATPYLHSYLQEEVFNLLPRFGTLLGNHSKAVRHMVARCIATLADIDTCRVMKFVVNSLVLHLQNISDVCERQGAIEAIERVVDKLQMKVVPYIVLLVVPLLGCMSYPDEPVRLLSTSCFATLVQLMPLDSKANEAKNEIKCEQLQAQKTKDREFLDFLFSPKTIPDYKVPVSLTVELRSYQQAGVNWLWFLNKYNLHGILCDDMGLGKTLQTICILAGDHYQRQLDKAKPFPSLVICPPTLTGHWVYEVEKFLKSNDVLRPLHYVGLPVVRERLRTRIGYCNLVVASYDTIRKDIDFFSEIHWNYCVLDEGHIIKNGKTKGTKAIKRLTALHRLILSGTPIQNNVLELWSLFDFLMPGFLGTERQFVVRYSRPMLAARDSKSSSKEQEASVLAMEALHRQVLPFLLRRVKEDVLTDLPPKITQDLLCELSPLQVRLYEEFSHKHLKQFNLLDNGEIVVNAKTHIFQALRYLQNVCNHPKLVLKDENELLKVSLDLQKQQSTLDDIEHSAKLPALKQLLLDCGIGVHTESVSQHRALIFCQLKAMLDIVEKDLLQKHLPSVSYLRLDGSVPASLRQDIVNTFNYDPSIDVLLLTTQVGGLGLNLNGADTVIFVEHDWNPMKDLQAMDRAHRIGQKKVVNVYRLITRNSLEEKIMGLQKFKILTANTVVSSENASMHTMATENLLDLFNLDVNSKNGNDKNNSFSTNTGASSSSSSSSLVGSSSGIGSGIGGLALTSLIKELPELWSEQQYDEEYDVTNFMKNLKKNEAT